MSSLCCFKWQVCGQFYDLGKLTSRTQAITINIYLAMETQLYKLNIFLALSFVRVASHQVQIMQITQFSQTVLRSLSLFCFSWVSWCNLFLLGLIFQYQYKFEHVFDEYSSQKAVFERVALPLVEDLIFGRNGESFVESQRSEILKLNLKPLLYHVSLLTLVTGTVSECGCDWRAGQKPKTLATLCGVAYRDWFLMRVRLDGRFSYGLSKVYSCSCKHGQT